MYPEEFINDSKEDSRLLLDAYSSVLLTPASDKLKSYAIEKGCL
jgi:hypothetical protein